MIVLKRVTTGDHGTFGVLLKDGVPLCVTLEPPWKNNQKNISCIPQGEYEVEPFSGRKGTDIWRFKNVPNRSDILIHSGNWVHHTEGCILVGKSFNRHMITSSSDTIEMLQVTLPKHFTIEVLDA